MKKILLTILVVFCFSLNNSYSQSSGDMMNPVLEYQTGTWCQYCPCAHTIIDVLRNNYPNMIVIAYHGAGNDPWIAPSAGIRPQFGWTGYPQGAINRKYGKLDRGQWNSIMNLASLETPTVDINVASKNYDASTRTLTCAVDITPRVHLDGDYSVNFVLTEGGITYVQTGNSGCPGASAYRHEHVVKAMMNGDMGETTASTHWMQGVTVRKNLTYVIPQDVIAGSCNVNVFVYKTGTDISSNYTIQQALSFPVPATSGIGNTSNFAAEYKLAQNYPNPFNPVTNIEFALPKDGNVSFKVYDMLGNEIAEVMNEFRKAGSYSVTFDGSKLASGIYYYKMESNNFSETKKMMLIK